MRPVDFTSFVGRSQDVSPIKQAEATKPIVQQQNIGIINEKQTELKQEQVNAKDNPDTDLEFDSSKEGKGQYNSSQHKRKKQEEDEDGKVTIKRKTGFDIKI